MPDESEHSLHGKTVVITGATSGIGEATAVAFAAAGATVTVTGRRRDRLEALVKRISETGSKAFLFEGDVTDEAHVTAMVEQAGRDMGRIDILVNNAGVMLLGPVLAADTEDWRRMINTNLFGLLYATHAVLPQMVKRGDGHIIQVSSVAGRHANAGSAVYNASKFGVNAFTEALRQEVTAKGVRTTLIEPGIVETELRQHITHEDTRKTTDQWASSMRQLQSKDIANAIIYAASQPNYVNVNEMLIRPIDQER